MNSKPLIAIVDDDAAIRVGLSSLLRSAGYAVNLFACAEDFLAGLPETTPDCLVTDIQMPGISGLELQSRLGAIRSSIPVLVMTAFPEPALRDRAISAGAVCFLSKPFDAAELLDCVKQVLGA